MNIRKDNNPLQKGTKKDQTRHIILYIQCMILKKRHKKKGQTRTIALFVSLSPCSHRLKKTTVRDYINKYSHYGVISA